MVGLSDSKVRYYRFSFNLRVLLSFIFYLESGNPPGLLILSDNQMISSKLT